MKQFSCLPIILLIVFISCDNNAGEEDKSTSKIAEVQNRAINAEQWRVTKYSESNTNLATDFAGYIFEFDSNNLLTVTNGSDNFSGNWSVINDGKDDTRTEFADIDFNLHFTNPPVFEKLNKDWEIISMTESKIELRHISIGDNSGDLLTFEKI